MAARAQELAWFTDIEMDGRTLPEHEAQIARLPGTLMIDHIGKFLEPVPRRSSRRRRADAAGRERAHLCEDRVALRFIALRAAGLRGPGAARRRCWCAPRRSGWSGPATGRTRRSPSSKRPDDAAWLDLMSEWMDETTRRKMLVDNPADAVRLLSFQGPYREINEENMPKHRIAIIGLGMAVTPHAKSLVDLKDRVEVVHAFSPSAARRKAFAEKFPFPLADSLDAILGRQERRLRRNPHAAEHASRSGAASAPRPASISCWRSRWRFRPRAALALVEAAAQGRRDARRDAAASLPPRRAEAARDAARGRTRQDRQLLDRDPPVAAAELLRRGRPRHARRATAAAC